MPLDGNEDLSVGRQRFVGTTRGLQGFLPYGFENFDDRRYQPLQGRIGYISSVAEFTPKTVQTEDLRSSLVYEVRVLADDSGDRLRLGMPATVRIALDSQQQQAKSESRP